MADRRQEPPLAGVRVLDASRVLAGPYAAMMLGDLGADVIKLEHPDGGDQTRAWGPPFVKGESAYYLSVNRNKRSVALNLKAPEGQEIFRKLAERSDVVIENFRPGALERLGLDYEALTPRNPRLIWCSITGYGRQSPWAERPAYDIALQAESGWMSITGEEGGEPVRIGVAIVDLFTAHYAVQAVLAALWARERTGRGQRIDLAMLDCGVASLTYMAQYYWATGEPPRRLGSRHPTIVPYQAFPAQDEKHLVVAVGSPAIWERFCRALGHPEWTDDPRFVDNAARVKHREELERLLVEVFRRKPLEEWLEILNEHDVPATPVNDLAAIWGLPPLRARGMMGTVEHPTIGELSILGSPLKLERTPPRLRRHPPGLGEHTREILQELGYDDARIEALRERGVLRVEESVKKY